MRCKEIVLKCGIITILSHVFPMICSQLSFIHIFLPQSVVIHPDLFYALIILFCFHVSVTAVLSLIVSCAGYVY
jgi:hypothetical protein